MEPRVMWSDLDAAANCSEATFGVDFGKIGEKHNSYIRQHKG